MCYKTSLRRKGWCVREGSTKLGLVCDPPAWQGEGGRESRDMAEPPSQGAALQRLPWSRAGSAAMALPAPLPARSVELAPASVASPVAAAAGRELHVSGSAELSAGPDRARVSVRLGSRKGAAGAARSSVSRRLEYIAHSARHRGVPVRGRRGLRGLRARRWEGAVGVGVPPAGQSSGCCEAVLEGSALRAIKNKTWQSRAAVGRWLALGASRRNGTNQTCGGVSGWVWTPKKHSKPCLWWDKWLGLKVSYSRRPPGSLCRFRAFTDELRKREMTVCSQIIQYGNKSIADLSQKKTIL